MFQEWLLVSEIFQALLFFLLDLAEFVAFLAPTASRDFLVLLLSLTVLIVPAALSFLSAPLALSFLLAPRELAASPPDPNLLALLLALTFLPFLLDPNQAALLTPLLYPQVLLALLSPTLSLAFLKLLSFLRAPPRFKVLSLP